MGSGTCSQRDRSGVSIGDAVAEGYRINLPLRTVGGSGRGVEPLVRVSNLAVVVESVKFAEDRSGDVVVRLYESRGGRAATTVDAGFEHNTVEFTDLLERPINDPRSPHEFELRPFQIATLRYRR